MTGIALRTLQGSRLRGLLIVAALSAAAAGPAIAAKFYIDSKVGDLQPSEIVTVADPKPAQLLFEFQTDGVPNAKATKYAKPIAIESINKRHVFSELSEEAAPGKAVLTISMNNITEKGAAGKGFKTGLTFGLAPLSVTDRYAVHFELLRGPGIAPLTCDVAHALHMTMGKGEDPSIGTLVKNGVEGIQKIIDQSMAHGVNCLAGKMAATPAAPGQ
jgi:hypothetical protein